MKITDDKITEIFYLANEFCIEFDQSINGHLLGNIPKRKPKMSTSEVITITILFHYGQFRNLKHFYLGYVVKHLSSFFPDTVSYNRFVELIKYEVEKSNQMVCFY